MDAAGNLVAIIHDLQIDVPAPESEARGGVVGAAAKVYRLKIPQGEVAVSYTVEATPGSGPQLHAKVVDFNPGVNAEVLAIADDETKGVALSRLSAAVVLGTLGGRLRSQPINVSLAQLNLPGITIRSVSSLDPSGWVRVGLERMPGAPAFAQTVPAPNSQPSVVAQPAGGGLATAETQP